MGTSDEQLTMMLTLADSRLPIGGHVHSGGIEEAITGGTVGSLDSVRDFLIRRIETTGLVAASIAAAVADGRMEPARADVAVDARTPSPAARAASRTQGRGMLRLARRVWPEADFSAHKTKPHLPVITGAVARHLNMNGHRTALVTIYTTMTGSATAAQRLLALDPADVAVLGVQLASRCDAVARSAAEAVADVSDPMLDILAERHEVRDMPLFAS